MARKFCRKDRREKKITTKPLQVPATANEAELASTAVETAAGESTKGTIAVNQDCFEVHSCHPPQPAGTLPMNELWSGQHPAPPRVQM